MPKVNSCEHQAHSQSSHGSNRYEKCIKCKACEKVLFVWNCKADLGLVQKIINAQVDSMDKQVGEKSDARVNEQVNEESVINYLLLVCSCS